ncbi:hypothetical protein ElyMa_000274600 [Elysia marginata]|uniref:Uncharacterized protein n=1 Tax=Elysia marginata TaxID=1093978 RepID=A0AAV4F5K7_9GAST|nr:hypothetical protein ElyMa_000274600 [Elysia marginata]
MLFIMMIMMMITKKKNNNNNSSSKNNNKREEKEEKASPTESRRLQPSLACGETGDLGPGRAGCNVALAVMWWHGEPGRW